MALGGLDFQDSICCPSEAGGCYQVVCSDKRNLKDTFRAALFIEGASAPKIGDTITIDGVDTVLTEKNYAEYIVKWFQDAQYKCSTTINGEQTPIKITFMPWGTVKGTRPRSTKVMSDNAFDDKARIVGIEAPTTYELKYAPYNICWINDMLMNSYPDTIINFTNESIEILDSGEYSLTPTDGGLDWKGDGKTVSGNLVVTHAGKADMCHYYVPTNDLSRYLKSIKEQTSFTFDVKNAVFTGLTTPTCESIGKCKRFNGTVDTPFTISVAVKESTSCGEWLLLKDCTDDVPATDPIMIDSDTGEITSTGFATAGTYKYTVVFKNDCCVQGSYCTEITIK